MTALPVSNADNASHVRVRETSSWRSMRRVPRRLIGMDDGRPRKDHCTSKEAPDLSAVPAWRSGIGLGCISIIVRRPPVLVQDV